MPWSGHRHTGRLRLPEPASVRTTRVTVAVLSSWDRGQENPAVARCELPRQAYTSQPDFNRVGREQAERACPKMTSEGYTNSSWALVESADRVSVGMNPSAAERGPALTMRLGTRYTGRRAEQAWPGGAARPQTSGAPAVAEGGCEKERAGMATMASFRPLFHEVEQD